MFTKTVARRQYSGCSSSSLDMIGMNCPSDLGGVVPLSNRGTYPKHDPHLLSAFFRQAEVNVLGRIEMGGASLLQKLSGVIGMKTH